MSQSIEFSFSMRVTSNVPGVDADAVGPFSLVLSATSTRSLRRQVTVGASEWITIEVHDLVPWFWFFICDHATNGAKVGFGQGEPIKLAVGGPPALWPANPLDIPAVAGDGGASSVIVWLIEKT